MKSQFSYGFPMVFHIDMLVITTGEGRTDHTSAAPVSAAPDTYALLPSGRQGGGPPAATRTRPLERCRGFMHHLVISYSDSWGNHGKIMENRGT